MSLEIERKFLVANEGWKTAVIRSVRIRDGLIANNKGHKARVRIANDVATIALKSRRRGPVRTEFEYAIPYSDAEEMLRTMCDGNVLEKVRHFVSHEGNNWHVDVYEGLLDGVVPDCRRGDREARVHIAARWHSRVAIPARPRECRRLVVACASETKTDLRKASIS